MNLSEELSAEAIPVIQSSLGNKFWTKRTSLGNTLPCSLPHMDEIQGRSGQQGYHNQDEYAPPPPRLSPPVPSKSPAEQRLVIALDYGTTFTGISGLHSVLLRLQ